MKFYSDDGRIAGKCLDWVQGSLGILVVLFKRVGINNNGNKNESQVVYQDYYGGVNRRYHISAV